MKKITSILLLLFQIGLFAQVTIIVDEVPNNTPDNASIYIAGNFQNWMPGSPDHQLTKETNGNYSIVLEGVTGNFLFKFTRGDWTTVEGNENGGFIPDRSHSVIAGDTLILQIAGWEDLGGGGTNPEQSSAADNVQIITDSFYISNLDRYRRIWVYLPPDYDESMKDYPVLYMHDGQNVFDAYTSFVGEWEVDETLNNLFANGDEGVIVVGIDNGQGFRIDEYTPWVNAQYGGGEGDEYVDFIAFELKPYIDQSFRTLPDRLHTGIMGSSLGGLISLYGGIKHQSVFSKIGSFSPAYWINPELSNYITNTPITQDLRIYQMGGTLEGADFIEDMFSIESLLETVDSGEKIALLTEEFPDGQHSEWFWAREFGDAYVWLFDETISSVNEIANTVVELTIFPNPTDGEINLEVDLENETPLMIQLYATDGQLVYEQKINHLNQGAHTIALNVSEKVIQKLMLLKLSTNEEVIVERIYIE